jgi:hypothetical protein
MMKRLVAAALLAVANVAGVTSADSTVDMDEDESSGGVECVECTPDSSDGGRADALCLALSAVLDPLDVAWVVRDLNGGASAAAVVRRPSDHVAVISLAVDTQDTMWAGLLTQAFSFCRNQDALKVIVEAADVPPTAIQRVAESSGFQFSRMRETDGASVVECYTNLYWRPGGTSTPTSHHDHPAT